MMSSSVFAGSSRQSIFGDLSLSSQFYESMYSMYMKEIYEVEHKNDSILIHPQKNVTRGDAAYMLYHLLGLTYMDGKDFNDVPKSDDYYDAIETLAARGVIDGFTDETFRPKDPLTRGQMAKIIASAFEYQIQANPSIPYTDVTMAFKAYVHALSEQGITKGVTATKFEPNRSITRQEMAAFMYRAYKQVPGSAYNEFEVMNTVNELIRKTQNVIVQGLDKYYPNQKASNISDDMAQLALDPYLTSALTGYETSCYNCDNSNVLPNLDFALPYEILTQTDTLLKLDATVPTSSIQSGHRAIIELIRSSDSWKIKSYTTRSFEIDPLGLSLEEAMNYMRHAIPKVQTIEYTGKEPRFGLDLFLINGKDTYVFDVNTAELNQYYPIQ